LDPLTIAITGPNASDFVAVNSCQSTLAPRASCSVQITFTPSALGARNATLTVSSANASNSPVAVPLTGTGTTTLYTPTVSVNAQDTITPAQSETVTINVTPPTGVPTISTGPITPTGTVNLSGGGFSGAGKLSSGSSVVINIPAGVLALGNDVLTANYTPDSASSAIYTTASGSSTVTVVNPAFTLAGDPITVDQGSTIGNSTTIVVSAVGGFTGNVTLSAAITSSPAGAQDPPTFSFGNNPVAVLPPNVSTVFTVLTTRPTSNVRPGSAVSWYSAGGASLGCLLLIGVGKQARRWRAMLGAVLMLLFLSSAMVACGGNSGNNTGPTSPSTPGTTPGKYVVTVTGTAGAPFGPWSGQIQQRFSRTHPANLDSPGAE
jgi:trimeric autotransporter adhesin